MGKLCNALESSHIDFISQQQMFFVGTADMDGRVNISPKGLDSLYIANPNLIYWLNLTGSGNETAAHVLNQNRMTLMFCAFSGNPFILRAYGKAKIITPSSVDFNDVSNHFPKFTGIRQIFELEIDSVLNSCGFGVPLYDYLGQRPDLTNWVDKKGEDGLIQYQKKNNVLSLDGKPTDIKDTR